MSKPKIVGELVIVAYKAKDLPEREVVGKQDPFVVFRIGEFMEKTKTDLRGGQHPIWDDQVNLKIPEKKTKVVVQVYDEDAKRQELISETELDITKVLEDGEADDWYPLQYKGRPAGEIYLEMTFYSAKPPPKRTPTRYGMSKMHPRPTGYATPLPTQPYVTPIPNQQVRPPFPPQNIRPVHGHTPIESHSTPSYGHSSYPPQQQQQRPVYNYASPYPPPVPAPSISTGSQHHYPPQQQQPRPIMNNNGNTSRPSSYVGPPHSRPISPPGPSTYGSNNSASLLSSSYNPSPALSTTSHSNYAAGHPPNNTNTGYLPSNGYPPASNRNSYPGHSNHSPYPQPQTFGRFPESQQFSSGYVPHVDPTGTPFAAHQGTFNAGPGGYPPQQRPQQGYPPNNSGYPPQNQGYPPY